MWLIKPPGVYVPQEDTALLEESLRHESLPPGHHVLDVGTGTGVLALAASRAGAARVVAIDISRRAVLAARANAALSRRRVHVRRGDLLAPVAGQRFDLVLANPPYLPSHRAEPPARGPARAWDAGRDGRVLLDRLCAGVPALMRPGGVFLLVHSALSGPATTLRLLAEAGLSAEVTERRLVPFGPVLRSRADWLRARGMLWPPQDKEELVVIRARRLA
ncbi:HemK2/MTQ2 family protein methyltransferase [Streptomyces sp. NPDC001407]|uniref:HemK2/MTQ2 family protein methyltransferase n=1 Tax=unclassified Streptomyces TaxID=2593676 RepID=UPI0033D9EFDE